MKLFRYRRLSLKNVLGVTRVKKKIKSALGITAVVAARSDLVHRAFRERSGKEPR